MAIEMRLIDNFPEISQAAHADHHTDWNFFLHQFIEIAHRLVHFATISHAMIANMHPFGKILHNASRLDAKHGQGDTAHPQKRRIKKINTRTNTKSHRFTDLISVVLQHIQKSACLTMLSSRIGIVFYHRDVLTLEK